MLRALWLKKHKLSWVFGIDVHMVRCIAADDSQAIVLAARALQDGALLGLPTETVYGLAADANNPNAVAAIFAAKGRPTNHPLIVHVAPQATLAQWRALLDSFCDHVPDMAWPLIEAFWPGPLTLILPRRPGVCAAAAGGQSTLGVRCPSHPVAVAVLRDAATLGVIGVAAPSANRFGRVSPTTAAHVIDEFDGRLSEDALLVLDGGDCAVGIESTIVDVCGENPVLLRPGHITSVQVAQVTGLAVLGVQQQSPQVSGSLESHYAPEARVHVVDANSLRAHVARLPAHDLAACAVYGSAALLSALPATVCVREMPTDAVACAHDLFAALRALDAADVADIWVEAPPLDLLWDGVRDRLKRASAPPPTPPTGTAPSAL